MLTLGKRSSSGNAVGGNGGGQDPNKNSKLGATGHKVDGAGKQTRLQAKGSKLKPLTQPPGYTDDSKQDSGQRTHSQKAVTPLFPKK